MTNSNLPAQQPSMDQILKDRVRKVLFDTVPDEQIEALIKGAWDDFFKPQPLRHAHGGIRPDRPWPSRFEKLVAAEIEMQLKPHIREAVQKTLADIQDEGPAYTTVVINTLLPGLQESILNSFAQSVLSHVQSQLHYFGS